MEPTTHHTHHSRRAGIAPDGARLALARRRHRRREGDPDPHRRRRSSSTPRSSNASSISGPKQKGAHMCRFEEVVNDAIGEVVLGESAFPRRAPRAAHRRARARAPGRGARRGRRSRRATRSTSRRPVSGIPTQEIYTLYGSAVASASGTRRLVGVAAQGMTACPCAQQLVAGARARAPHRRRLQRRRDRPHLRRTCRSRRTTSAGSARCTSAAPRTATPTSTRRCCWRSSRSR